MTMAPRITVAISTMGERSQGIRLPDPVSEIVYLILVQNAAEPAAEKLVERADVSFRHLATRGLSESRNAALDLCDTPFLLFADDDMALFPKGIVALADHLANRPDLSLAAGWRNSAFRTYRRSGRTHVLSRWNAGRICAPEFMVVVAQVRSSGTWFDPEFGAGSALATGEDYIFVSDLLRRGLKARSFPIVTGEHIGPSTGADWQTISLLHARRAVLARVFGWKAPLVACIYALRHARRFETLGTLARFCCKRLRKAA